MENITLTLTHEEYKIILETLLFSSTVDIGADWTNKDSEKFLQLALKLKNIKNVKLSKKRIHIHNMLPYEDTHITEVIKKEFKI